MGKVLRPCVREDGRNIITSVREDGRNIVNSVRRCSAGRTGARWSMPRGRARGRRQTGACSAQSLQPGQHAGEVAAIHAQLGVQFPRGQLVASLVHRHQSAESPLVARRDEGDDERQQLKRELGALAALWPRHDALDRAPNGSRPCWDEAWSSSMISCNVASEGRPARKGARHGHRRGVVSFATGRQPLAEMFGVDSTASPVDPAETRS